MAKNNKTVKVDTAAGSCSYNRLDMQVSQTLHMAIELYDPIYDIDVLKKWAEKEVGINMLD